MSMSSAGRAENSNGCVTRPKGREIGLSGFAAQIQLIRSLAAMSWQRPNIGSRMNREVHVRFWERPGVKVLRATRHFRPTLRVSAAFRCLLFPESDLLTARQRNDAMGQIRSS